MRKLSGVRRRAAGRAGAIEFAAAAVVLLACVTLAAVQGKFLYATPILVLLLILGLLDMMSPPRKKG